MMNLRKPLDGGQDVTNLRLGQHTTSNTNSGRRAKHDAVCVHSWQRAEMRPEPDPARPAKFSFGHGCRVLWQERHSISRESRLLVVHQEEQV